jgi:hypothetical protein
MNQAYEEQQPFHMNMDGGSSLQGWLGCHSAAVEQQNNNQSLGTSIQYPTQDRTQRCVLSREQLSPGQHARSITLDLNGKEL